MKKKDRIAISLSALYLLWPLFLLFSNFPEACVAFLAPLVAYWGYRFVKGDISFITIKMDD